MSAPRPPPIWHLYSLMHYPSNMFLSISDKLKTASGDLVELPQSLGRVSASALTKTMSHSRKKTYLAMGEVLSLDFWIPSRFIDKRLIGIVIKLS